MSASGVDRLASGKYRARYYDGDGKRRSKAFAGSREAAKWLRSQQAAVDAGRHIDPNAGRVTFGDYADGWLSGQSMDPATRQAVSLRLRVHAYPVLGRLQLRSVTPSHIRAWQATLEPLAPSYRRVIFVNVSSVFGAAVDDEVIVRNPCRVASVKAPTVAARKVVPWTAEQVLGVRDGLTEPYRVLATIGAGLGMRQGEMFALSPDDVDFLRGRVEVRRQVKVMSGSRLVFALPKGGKVRTVPLPASVRDALAAHLAQHPTRAVTLPWGDVDGPATTVSLVVSGREGKALNRNYVNTHVWKRALRAAGVEPSRDNGMHALRHFYASVLLDAGESIKAVSEYLGHSDAGFTLGTYTHLMPASDERSRRAVDAVMAVRVMGGSPGAADPR